jgi:DNA polymerase-3 subunit gamma/tau
MSEQYIVSARKYRPQTFDTVVGQSHITQTLKNAIKTEHLAHAYLFCGPRGVGKTTCARILARTINCEHPTPEMEACGECSTCVSFRDNTSFNIFELDAASNNSVDDIRRLTEQVRYAPQHGRYKIYIIDEVHMLSSAAFNAFLKTLEEPPPYAIFILATTEKHKILPTILSRCQIFDFKRIQTEDIVAHLAAICGKEGMESENAALHIIAQKSEGCMRDALSMMDRIAGFSGGRLSYAQVVEHLNILDAEVYFHMADMLLAGDVSGALLYLDDILQKGFEGDLILNGFAEHFRNILLSRDGRMARLIDLPEEHKRAYFDHAQMISEPYVLSALSLLNEAELGYRNALNKRLHLELALIRLCYLNDLVSPSEELLQAPLKKKPLAEKPAKPLQRNPVLPSRPDMAREEDTPSYQPVKKAAPKAGNTFSKNEASVPEEAETAQAPEIKGPPKPKLSRNILSQLQAQNQHKEEEKCIALDNDMAQKLLEEFKAGLRKIPKELPAVAQMDEMEIKCISENELQFICNSEINETYGRKKSTGFRAFCQEKTGNKNLRITTFFDQEAKKAEPKHKVLSKLEVFEAMAAKNPNLLLLKNALNLNVEY